MTPEEMDQMERQLRPIVEAARKRGEDLSTPADMERFVARVLEQNGYVLRGNTYLVPSN